MGWNKWKALLERLKVETDNESIITTTLLSGRETRSLENLIVPGPISAFPSRGSCEGDSFSQSVWRFLC